MKPVLKPPYDGYPTMTSVPDGVLQYSHQAMATTFELYLAEAESAYAAQAAQACFRLLDQIELQLSRYLENSDIARIAALPAGGRLILGTHTYACLALSEELRRATAGAFDIGYAGRDRSAGPNQELFSLRSPTVEIESLVDRPTLDLGAIGKGYALDQLAQLLEEWGIVRALLQGGRSSVLALDAPPGRPGWDLTISHPEPQYRVLARLSLKNRAVGASGIRKGSHIISPITDSSRSEARILAAWTVGASAARMDALSTAAMLLADSVLAETCADQNYNVVRLVTTPADPAACQPDRLQLFGDDQTLFNLS